MSLVAELVELFLASRAAGAAASGAAASGAAARPAILAICAAIITPILAVRAAILSPFHSVCLSFGARQRQYSSGSRNAERGC